MELGFPASLLEKPQVHSRATVGMHSTWCMGCLLQSSSADISVARKLPLMCAGAPDPGCLWLGNLPEIAKPFWVLSTCQAPCGPRVCPDLDALCLTVLSYN